jgi:hypothetical protein
VAGIDEVDIGSSVHFGHDAIRGRTDDPKGVFDTFSAQCFDNRLAGFHLSHGFPHVRFLGKIEGEWANTIAWRELPAHSALSREP